MADELGTAVLRLDVDDTRARRAIGALREAIEGFRPDFKGVERGLANVSTEADRAKVRVQSLNQVLNQAPGATYARISAQISRLTRESRELKLSSEEYLKTLQRISELEFTRSARAGRQRATADFEAARGGTLTGGFGAESRLPAAPPTIAGDLQRLKELDFRLKNLQAGGAEFEIVLRQIEAIQRRVSEATDGSSEAFRRQERAIEATARRAQKLTQIQQYYSAQAQRAGGFRDPTSGAMIARGANAVADERAFRNALRANEQLLATDLKRLQAVREITQRLGDAQVSRLVSEDKGFAAFNRSITGRSIGENDPVEKSVRRELRRRARSEERRTIQLDRLDADLARVREARLQAEKRSAGLTGQLNASPVRGGAGFPGSPGFFESIFPAFPEAQVRRLAGQRQAAEAVAARRRSRDILSNAVIGGAFPLLFGQGLGASVGGATGGGLGGAVGGQFGFALSLLGTAVGAQFDAIIEKSKVLGNALDDPINQFGAVRDAGLLSSRGLERQVESLIAVGREAEAAAIIQADLAAAFGSAEAARRLTDEQDRLNRSWSELSLGLARLSLPNLASGADSAANALDGLNTILGRLPSLVPGQLLGGVDSGRPDFRQPFFSPFAPGFGAALIGAGLSRFSQRGTRQAEAEERARAAAEATGAEERRASILRDQVRLVSAQTQGYDEQALLLERSISLQQEEQDIRNLEARRGVEGDETKRLQIQAEIEERRNRGLLERARIQERLLAAERDFEQSVRQVDQQRELSAAAPGARGAIRQRQEIQELLRQSQEAVAKLDDPDLPQDQREALVRSAERFQNAATVAGLTFSDFVRESTEQLRRTAEDLTSRLRLAQLDLVNIQGDPRTDVNRFLPRETRVDQLRQSLTALTGPLQEAISTAIRSRAERGIQTTPEDFSRLTGIVERAASGGAVGFRGLEIVSGFIRAVEAETSARRNVETIQQDIVRTNGELVSINTELVTANRLVSDAVAALAAKDWNVEVNVDASGKVEATGDINRALP